MAATMGLRFRAILASSLVLAMLFGSRGAGQTATAASATSAGGDVSEYVAAIKSADTADAAMAAYAKGCLVNRNSIPLNEAYMRRMLQLSKPDIAAAPARVLTLADPTNGLAWGVLAYNSAKGNDLAGALASTIKAIPKATDNPPVMANAGQLYAAYDAGDIKLAADLKDSAAKAKALVATNKDFSAAYDAANQFYQKRQAAKADYDQKIAAATTDRDQAKQRLDDLDRQFKDQDAQLTAEKKVLSGYQNELNGINAKPANQQDQNRKATLTRLIADEQRKIADMQNALQKLRPDGQAAQADYQKKSQAVDALKQQSQAALAKMLPTFTWQPPTADAPAATSSSAPAASSLGPPISRSAPFPGGTV